MRLLVTGATGYIGGRLVPRLLDAGHDVRCLVRDRARLDGRPWVRAVEIAEGDVLKPETLTEAMANIDVAYYLIHSLGQGDDFHTRDQMAALNFGTVAQVADVKRIVYLGGLGDPNANLSQHLRSRQETGRALGEAGVPVTEFRAAIIVGSGSVSFEMVRYLTERLPVMICPRWVYTKVQPISTRNVLQYLVSALKAPASTGRVIEIGGADVLTYSDMMREYARERQLRRWLIPVPVLTPKLSSYWVHWITPVSASITRPLIEGLRNQVIVRDDNAQQLFPDIKPMGYRPAVRQTLSRLARGNIETAWSDALSTSHRQVTPVVFTTDQGMILERRQRVVDASPESVFRVFSGLGGQRGWFYANWAWQIRGAIDRLAGGVGLRRGRRDPNAVRVGDALDFWRVEAVIPNRLVRLRAEMKVPGLAWLQFEAQGMNNGRTHLFQTAYFAPRGLWGLLYWYILYPMHLFIFPGMIREISRRAEAQSQSGDPDSI